MRHADLVGVLGEAEGRHERHHEGHREGAGEVADKYQAPVSQNTAIVTPGRLSINASGASTNTPVRRSNPSKYNMENPTGKQQRSDDRLAGVHIDRDGEPGRECEDGAGHIGPDHGIPGGHEDFGFSGIHHLGDEFRRH